MAVEVISGQGTLRSEGGRYQRQCKLEITREPVKVDEEGAPLKYLYQKVSVVDSDDFPEGIYHPELQRPDRPTQKDEGRSLLGRVANYV